MRYLLAVLLLAAAVRPAAAWEGDEAKKLFQAMQAKVVAAKTLKVHFDISVTDARGKKGAVKGTLILGEDQKYRAEAEGKLFGEEVKFTEVSDGNTAVYRDAADRKRDSREKAIKNAGTYFRAGLPREGFLASSLNMKERSGWSKEDFKLTDFQLAGKEKVNDREAQVIRYKLSAKGSAEPLPVKVWLDTKTNLPVRLAITGGKSDIQDITETYGEFSIDAKVDAKAFELPK